MSIAAAFGLVAMASAVMLVSGCVGAPHGNAGDGDKPMKIELLGFEGCPNTPAMRDNLRAALGPGRESEFTEVNQEALPESDLRRGWPTPTILVDGHDLFGMPAPSAPAMGCRMYPDGVPSAAEIRARLDQHLQRRAPSQ